MLEKERGNVANVSQLMIQGWASIVWLRLPNLFLGRGEDLLGDLGQIDCLLLLKVEGILAALLLLVA